ncbi:hypothetical protein MM0348_14940 [Helicobacter pylori]
MGISEKKIIQKKENSKETLKERVQRKTLRKKDNSKKAFKKSLKETP